MAKSYYSRDVHGPYEVFALGDFDLEDGGRIRDLTLAFATFGELSRRKDNAILFPTWYSGTSKILEQAYIGEGRALDPSRYFIILVNQIGNGLSKSPHDAPTPFNGPAFPKVSIGDDTRAQHKLLTERFGIAQLELVLGGSMGAQQTYEWAVRFPSVVKRAAPIAGLAGSTAHNRFLVDTFIEAITSDPAWEGGWYRDGSFVHRGLRRHARLFAASGFTPQLFNEAGWQSLGFSDTADFVSGFVEQLFLQHDPNNLLLMLSKWKNHDVSRLAGGSLKEALARITAKVSVIAIQNDAFFPLADIEAEQRLIAHSELAVIPSIWGHLALFGVDSAFNERLDAHLKALLAQS